MELRREHWSKEDISEFQSYLLSLSKGKDKCAWEQKIINTKLPCIAVPSTSVKKITTEISKGNYIEFLKFWPWENFTNTSIIGGIICKIKDFSVFEKYLDKYANMCDNWATCDCLKLNINDKTKKQFFELSNKYIISSKPFVRRLGLSILLKLANDDNYIDKIFSILNSFENEKEYYVNMMLAWITCECFIKNREKTLEFIKTNTLNKFTINKAISKCHDSYRISSEDKELLNKYRK